MQTQTCEQQLVSRNSLDYFQEVAGQREMSTLGLSFKLVDDSCKQRILLHTLVKQLQGLVKPAYVLCIELEGGCGYSY